MTLLLPLDDGATQQALADAETLAREAAVADTGAEQVGAHVGAEREDAVSLTHLFEAHVPGYRGWRWSVTVATAGEGEPITVSEVVLRPGPDALTAPKWVPWENRVRAGDLGVGDIFPTPVDDLRLVPGYIDTGEPEVEEVAREIGLGKPRVLSRLGREDAASRWHGGEFGPRADMARAAPSTCGTCGFYLELGGSLRAAFGVCGNDIAPADGHVVHAEYGCGAHSEVVVEASSSVPIAALVYDDSLLDTEPVPEPATKSEDDGTGETVTAEPTAGNKETPTDAAPTDAAVTDAASSDATPTDATPTDATAMDAAVTDAASSDVEATPGESTATSVVTGAVPATGAPVLASAADAAAAPESVPAEATTEESTETTTAPAVGTATTDSGNAPVPSVAEGTATDTTDGADTAETARPATASPTAAGTETAAGTDAASSGTTATDDTATDDTATGATATDDSATSPTTDVAESDSTAGDAAPANPTAALSDADTTPADTTPADTTPADAAAAETATDTAAGVDATDTVTGPDTTDEIADAAESATETTDDGAGTERSAATDAAAGKDATGAGDESTGAADEA